MIIAITTAADTPPFARAMHERLARVGPIEGSSSSVRDGEVVAWAAAVTMPDHVLVAAVAKRESGTIVAIRADAPELAAMAMARSLVHRSAKRIAQGGLCPAHFGDLESVPFAVRAPQFVVGPAEGWGLSLPGVSLAVACSWQEMALDPPAREAAVRARAPGGLSGDVLAPAAGAGISGALEGMSRSLRKAKEPLASNAAWAMESLIADHLELVRDRLQELALVPTLDEDRAELVGALVDSLNPVVIDRLPATGPTSSARVVLCQLRLPKSAGGRVVTAYFFDASNAAQSKLGSRLPEAPLGADVVAAGFERLDGVFGKHQPTVQLALAVEGALRLQRGFHADASLDEVVASFVADGFTPVRLVLDADADD